MSMHHMPPGLYIVATPIGNREDITLRALDVLRRVDAVVCEDTRVTGALLAHYDIHKPLISYNDHNAPQRRPHILAQLAEGGRLALVSDAGTPLISDPGYKLVRETYAREMHVSVLPGASSVISALCLSGLPSDRFMFAGFLPSKTEAARQMIAELGVVPTTLIWFESAKRLPETMTLLHEMLGVREAAVVREISKLHEESRRSTLAELAQYYTQQGAPKGEVVIVVGPSPLSVSPPLEQAVPLLKKLLEHCSVKESAELVATATGLTRKAIYQCALALKDGDESAR